jgi:hypothetical protein
MSFRGMKSLERKAGDYGPADSMMATPSPNVDSGLCLCLDDHALEALDLDDTDVEVGDLLHLRVMVEVTSVHKDAMGSRISGAIVHGVVEDEDKEGDEPEDEGEE